MIRRKTRSRRSASWRWRESEKIAENPSEFCVKGEAGSTRVQLLFRALVEISLFVLRSWEVRVLSRTSRWVEISIKNVYLLGARVGRYDRRLEVNEAGWGEWDRVEVLMVVT